MSRTSDTALSGAALRALLLASFALAALSLLLPSTPSYDPWAWILWGREIASFDLSTTGGPSWKPLPVLFTTPFALAGGAAPELWLVVARAGGILALVFAFRLGWRLLGGGPRGIAAGALAVVGIALTTNWLENVALGYSEGMLTALLLFAAERHLDGRHAQAYGLGIAAALLRPEVWPFLGLYALWLWVRRAEHRVLVAGLSLLVPLLWFLPELWGSGEPFRASERAQQAVGSSPALTDEPARELLRRAEAYLALPVEIGFAIALLLAAAARRRTELVLSIAALAWVGLVALMTSRGYAGNERYLAFPLALAAVMAGVGWVRLPEAAANVLSRVRAGAHARATAAVLAALALALVVAVGDAPLKAEQLSADTRALRYQGELYEDLELAVQGAGGPAAVLACGQPVTGPYQVPALAWHLDTHVTGVHIDESRPGTVFSARATSRSAWAPERPGKRSGYERVAATQAWQVYGDCFEDPDGPAQAGKQGATKGPGDGRRARLR